MNIKEILHKIKQVPYLAVTGDCSLPEASEKAIQMPQVRGIYVLDDKQQLEGYLSLGLLISHIVYTRYRPNFHVRSLLTTITARNVADIMEREVFSARPEDELVSVLGKMLRRNMKQVPVVGNDARIITVASILEIWRWIQHSERLPENFSLFAP